MADVKTLSQRLVEEFGRRTIEATVLPSTLMENLTPSFPLRPYQVRAFQFFCKYWEEAFDGKPRQNHQLLFHMATGSGKTMMMAGLILYLYQQGYRHFLFFVNSNTIIDKTKDNFLNALSQKYLFAKEIRVGDRSVEIRAAENFQSANQDDLTIVFSTIQGLHLSLNTPRENGLTYDDFEHDRLVMISDEAHHINVETKKGNPQLTQRERSEMISWEGTVERMLRAHEDNVLLEFTATVDLSDEHLALKYHPKLIVDYPLKEFRKDGYSKEVKVLQADMAPLDRALQAVLLSQYRRKLFERYKKHIKPVVLFKSKTIKESQAFLDSFKAQISSLTPHDLGVIRRRSQDPIVLRMFAYFAAAGISFENLVIELREDFSDDKLLVVNSQEESEARQLAVNSLEDERNGYRAVFAVDKLNEGWDVLNLFDIVRLYDTRDSKAGKVGKTTMSEAQLIGRGARYCPFRLTDDQSLYSRKFDADLDHELRVCEELYYHSAYNPKYIQELNTALQDIGIKAKETRERYIMVKEAFKRTSLYKTGYVLLNQRIRHERARGAGLNDTVVMRRYQIALRTGYTRSVVAFEPGTDKDMMNKTSRDYALLAFGVPIIRKALQRLPFYEFATLKRFLPHLTSIREFITSAKYLGRIQVEITGLPEQVIHLSADEKLDAAVQVLEAMAQCIASETLIYTGSTTFLPSKIKDIFTDKHLTFAQDDGGDREFGRSMNDSSETAYHLDLSSRDWYVFSDCFGTSEEKLLIQFIDKQYQELKRKYSEVYLIRNEKQFKLFDFADGRPFEPDFVLYLIGKKPKAPVYYQVFIEPKGSHLLKADEWKEQFLKSIKQLSQIEQLFSNTRCAVWGLPFFNSESRDEEFVRAFHAVGAS